MDKTPSLSSLINETALRVLNKDISDMLKYIEDNTEFKLIVDAGEYASRIERVVVAHRHMAARAGVNYYIVISVEYVSVLLDYVDIMGTTGENTRVVMGRWKHNNNMDDLHTAIVAATNRCNQILDGVIDEQSIISKCI